MEFNAYGRGGNPRSDQERADRHEQKYGSRNTPPRGSGKGLNIGSLSSLVNPTTDMKYAIAFGAVLGAVGAYLLMTRVFKKGK